MTSTAHSRIVVLNYNGRALLEKCLPSIVAASKHAKNQCLVTILDNCSVDDSRQWVSRNFPDVEWVQTKANKILCSYNDYAVGLTEPYLIFLNNDISVEPDFIDPLLEPLEQDPAVFFSAPQVYQMDTREYEGSLSKLHLRFGLIWGDARFPGYKNKINQPANTMQTGFGAFRREYFLHLGGYDDLYLPGTVEDADLCFRAYRQGWLGRYVPSSVVYHIGQASFKKEFGSKKLRRMNRRNLYLFMWKNIHDPLYLLIHFLSIPIHLFKYLIMGEWEFIGGFFDACRLWREAVKRRASLVKRGDGISDRKIFSMSKAI